MEIMGSRSSRTPSMFHLKIPFGPWIYHEVNSCRFRKPPWFHCDYDPQMVGFSTSMLVWRESNQVGGRKSRHHEDIMGICGTQSFRMCWLERWLFGRRRFFFLPPSKKVFPARASTGSLQVLVKYDGGILGQSQ